MIAQQNNGLKLLKFSKLNSFKDIIHYSTTRNGGYSKSHLASLNLGYTVKDKTLNVTQNINLLAKSLQIEKSQFVFPKQTHSANIGIVKSTKNIFPNTDALVTNIPGICISARTADCVPILLLDPVKKVIAAIHSGWKGTAHKISWKTIELMQQKFDTKPSNIIAGIGPSIGPGVYEVGSDVVDEFHKYFNENPFFMRKNNSEKFLLNLWEANKQILLEAGLFEYNIEIAGMCTYSNPDLFYSARRDKNKTGRLASGIMLK